MGKKFEKFGEIVKMIRKDRNLSQSELGEKIGVHSQFVSNAERALCNLPKPSMKKFVSKLSVSEDERIEILNAIVQDAAKHTREEWSKPLGLK